MALKKGSFIIEHNIVVFSLSSDFLEFFDLFVAQDRKISAKKKKDFLKYIMFRIFNFFENVILMCWALKIQRILYAKSKCKCKFVQKYKQAIRIKISTAG